MANDATVQTISTLLQNDEQKILTEWLEDQTSAPGFRSDRISRQELSDESRRFLAAFRDSLGSGDDIRAPGWSQAREVLDTLSESRAIQGFTPSETAMFVFSLKEVMFDRLRHALGNDPARLAETWWRASTLLDRLGLYTMEVFQRSRESVIVRQQQEMMELSTPVVTLWNDILALPLIGTLDSERTQVVMENLLQRIVETGAMIAIIDITGVPTVDTLTAQHLLKTVAAARLMGADCIISGIRPQIAQTIVHLGVDLGTVATKATLADAFGVALKRLGLAVTRTEQKGARRDTPHSDATPPETKGEF